jgi:peptidoglycan L-alanyl-D-glutamate endopeptidase CwlK
MPNRRIEDLCPEMQLKFAQFKACCEEEGLKFIVTCTTRTQAEQDELYAQGRTKPGKKVTWTRKSQHQTGRAFDFVPVVGGKCIWNDFNLLGRYGQIAEELGLQWGIRMANGERKDLFHIQLRG